VTGDFARLPDFVSPDLAQHTPNVADGIAPLQAFATETAMRYIELHKVVGAGNFVAVLAESELNGKRHAVIDLFRVEEGTIVEHWDVIEEITPEPWVNVGKF
jgi:predicted SnoaL-like aldol condensation-catalyzing enzyme